MRKINFANQVNVRLLFLVVEFDTNQQIFLKALLVETSSIRTFDENIQFCK